MSFNALSIAATALQSTQFQVEHVAHNIANVESISYKKRTPITTDLFYQTLQSAGVRENEELFAKPTGIYSGSGSKISAILTDHSIGDMKQTNRTLDVFIGGPGFIAINLPEAQRGYTRNGSFKIDGETRLLVDSKGRVLSSNIAIPEATALENISITEDGKVQVKNFENGEIEDLGTIELFTFNNLDGLESLEGGVFLANEASGDEVLLTNNLYKIKQGYLESSNIEIFQELIVLMQLQRGYEANTRVIKVFDDIAKETNNIKT